MYSRTNQNELVVHVAFGGLTSQVTACHIHYSGTIFGSANLPIYNLTDSVNGGCLGFATFNMDSSTNLLSGAATNLSDILNLEAGMFYVNVHTANNIYGEIAGTLSAVQPNANIFFAEPLFSGGTGNVYGVSFAYISGSTIKFYNNFLAPSSTIMSCGVVSSASTSTILYNFGFGGSLPCNGVVSFPINSNGQSLRDIDQLYSGKYGLAAFMNGNSNPVVTSPYHFELIAIAALIPAAGTTGVTTTGSASISISNSGVAVNLAHNAAATLCHVHYSPTGPTGSGSPVYNLTNPNGVGCLTQSTFALNSASNLMTHVLLNLVDVEEVLSGNYYVNVHTAANPNGEISGFLFNGNPTGTAGIPTIYAYPLSPTSVAAVTSPVTAATVEGHAAVVITGNKLYVYVAVTSPNTVIMCHIHYSPSGPAGSGIPVYNMTNTQTGLCNPVSIFTINTNTDVAGALYPLGTPMNITDQTALNNGQYYVNVHTNAYVNGEVRANLIILPTIVLATAAPTNGPTNTPTNMPTGPSTGSSVLVSAMGVFGAAIAALVVAFMA